MGDGGGGHWLVWMDWRPAGWSVCLPLLTFHCTIKSRSSLLAPAHPGGPGKRALKRLWCGGGDAEKEKHVMFVDSNAVLKLKFQRLHSTVVNSVTAARIIDFLFQERVLVEDDVYRSVIYLLMIIIKIETEIIYFT